MDVTLSATAQVTDESRDWLIEGIRAAITACAEVVGVDLAQIARVIVADEPSYGPAIRDLTTGPIDRTHTDTEFHKGVAKTVLLPGGTHGLVFRDFVAHLASLRLAQLNGADIEGMALSESGPELGLYIVCHELGHVRDDIVRSNRLPASASRNDRFSSEAIAQEYTPIILSEYAACRHSAALMTDSVFRDEIANFADDFASVGARLVAQVRDYQAGRVELNAFAGSVAHATWVLMVQATKLLAAEHETDLLWDREGLHASVRDALNGLSETLKQAWEFYPAARAETFELLFAKWRALCLATGFQFVPGNPHDAFYFVDTAVVAILGQGKQL